MTTTKLTDGLVPTTALRNGAALPEIEVVDVSPALAREWMKRNELNRNLRDGKVQQYVADMRSGDWRWTGESIKFDSNGNLIDGQHRLTAIVLSETTIKLLVVRNLEPVAQEELDQGITRTFGDVLKLRGETAPGELASLTRRVASWESTTRRDFIHTSKTFSTPQLLRTLDAHPELRSAALRSRQMAHKCRLPGAMLGHLIWLFERINLDDATFFFERLADGQRMQTGDPIFELRRTLAENAATTTKRSPLYLMAVTIKAWNAFREGRSSTNNPVEHYYWRVGGAAPEQFPEPK